jgi:hypothetical protein
MACDTRLKPRQTISQRKDEVRRATERFVAGLKSGKVKATVNAKGGVAFTGLTEDERDGVTDACAYRRVLASGSQLAILAIAKAEQFAGRPVNRQLVAQGYHTHDGENWHTH